MAASEIESLVSGASDWNEVLARFSDKVTPQAPEVQSSSLPEEKVVVVDLVQQLYWNLEEKVIEQV